MSTYTSQILSRKEWTFLIKLPVANKGNRGEISPTSLGCRLEFLRLSTSSSSSSSSKSSISSTVNSWSCGGSNDSGCDTFDTIHDDVATGIEGGARLGGDPEDSGFVTKKNSFSGPILLWSKKDIRSYQIEQCKHESSWKKQKNKKELW